MSAILNSSPVAGRFLLARRRSRKCLRERPRILAAAGRPGWTVRGVRVPSAPAEGEHKVGEEGPGGGSRGDHLLWLAVHEGGGAAGAGVLGVLVRGCVLPDTDVLHCYDGGGGERRR